MPTALPTGTINFMRIAARSAGKPYRPTWARSYALPVAWEETATEPQALPVLVKSATCAAWEATQPAIEHAGRIPMFSELVF